MVSAIESERAKTNNSSNKLFIFLFIMMAIFLNQSSVIFGINISLSDFICVFILISLIYKKRLFLPFAPTIFFLFLTVVLLFTATFYVPYKFYYNPNISSILVAYFKLIVVFVYFIIGYSVSYLDSNLIEKAVKWYAIFALLIGLLGIVFTILNVQLFSEVLFMWQIRFRGFVSDANFFSIVQISALVYFSRVKKIKVLQQVLYHFLILASILISGSKTGLITLACYSIFRVLEFLFKSPHKGGSKNKYTLLIILLVLILISLTGVIQDLIGYISSIIPSFARIQYLFTDFSSAISSSGSGRESTWKMAIEIIKDSPIIGIGIGTYIGVVVSIWNSGTVAHNTYLQLFSEWGIPLSMIFFSYIFYKIAKAPLYSNNDLNIGLILRDILIVFLIGSMAISLNNARMFWLFLGSIEFISTTSRKRKQTVINRGSS